VGVVAPDEVEVAILLLELRVDHGFLGQLLEEPLHVFLAS
jgi:hypothetical protein